jgi:RHS repeat-associated protein
MATQIRRALFVLLALAFSFAWGAKPVANSPPVVSLTAPANGATFAAPATINLAATASDSDGTIAKVEFFVSGGKGKASLIGTSTAAPYTFTWSNVAAGTYSLTAKATDNGGAATSSAAVSITVAAGTNSQPTVSLTAPANGATFAAPATINLAASAADSDGTVSKVDFYQGTTLIGTSVSSPYALTWSNVAAGTYTLSAKATDNGGATTTSAAVSVTVSGSTNAPPTVGLTSPANGSSFTSPATINLAATAADSDGTVTKVDFYQGATLLGTSSAAPYAFTWSGVAAGSYSLTAKATDNAGAVTTSSAVSVTVAAPNGNILISSPANGAMIYGNSVTVTGTYVGSSTTSFVFADNGSSSRLATLSGNTYTATVPINLGDNTLTVSVARVDKTSDKTSITVKGNSAPLVVFKSPTSTAFNPPANVSATVDAVSPTGTVANVGFYKNSVLQGTVSTPPYQFNFANLATGNYTLGATATDNNGQAGSASLAIVVGTPNVPPTANITAPADGATYTAPAAISIAAAASDSDGTVAQVEFLQNGTLIGVTNVAPYTINWSNVAAGSYALTARATDNSGAATTSAPVNVTVQPSGGGGGGDSPVVITSPTSGANFLIPAVINLSATAPSGALGVSFYQQVNGNNILIGDSPSTSSPYTYAWTVQTAGTYTVVAKTVVFVQGFSDPFTFWSDPVTITVAFNPAGSITYLHNDFAGSVIAATDANGAVLWKEDYRPYGERIVNDPAADTNRQFFTGKPFDKDIGLSYMGARYYDPAVGRFMGVDAAGFSEGNVHSFNRFAYANNNPYRFVDPDGDSASEVLEAAYQWVVGMPGRIAERWSDPSKRLPNGPENAAAAAAAIFGGIAAGEARVAAPPARLPQDVNVNPVPPAALPLSRPIGTSETQNAAAQAQVKKMQAEGYRDIRVNQQQVNADGVRCGTCRPDIQGTNPGGVREYTEYDRSGSSRGPGHAQRLNANDPKGTVTQIKQD